MDLIQIKFFVLVIINGLAIGSVYALLALGFVLIYKATDTFNFAQGEFMMLGAYLAYVIIAVLGDKIGIGFAFIIAFCLSALITAFLASMAEIGTIRPMLGEPVLAIIMATIGLSFVLRGAVEFIWGPADLPFTDSFKGAPFLVYGIPIGENRFYAIITSLILTAAFFLFFKYSNKGLGMRATAEDQETAFLMGINVKRIFTMSWAIAAIISTVGGIFLASMVGSLVPYFSHVALRALPAIILGGMNSVHGAVIAGLILGICENMAGTYLANSLGGGDIKEISSYVIVLIIMMIRPHGLFGTKEIERV